MTTERAVAFIQALNQTLADTLGARHCGCRAGDCCGRGHTKHSDLEKQLLGDGATRTAFILGGYTGLLNYVRAEADRAA